LGTGTGVGDGTGAGSVGVGVGDGTGAGVGAGAGVFGVFFFLPGIVSVTIPFFAMIPLLPVPLMAV
jgi:hypothetical protein